MIVRPAISSALRQATRSTHIPRRQITLARPRPSRTPLTQTPSRCFTAISSRRAAQQADATPTLQKTSAKVPTTDLGADTEGQDAAREEQVMKGIARMVQEKPVVLFMKGTPELPQCGFSRATVQILQLQGVDPEKFAAFNVLEDAELRQAIKKYSDWPTIPQLYVDGEFVGGCDILMSMHQDQSLAQLLKDKNVVVEASDA